MDIFKTFFAQLDNRIFGYDFNNLFSKGYLFTVDPNVSTFQSWVIMLALVGIVAGWILRYYSYRSKGKLDKNIRFELRRLAVWTIWQAVIALILIFFRGQQIKYLSMRIWSVLLVVSIVGSAIFSIYKISEIKLKTRAQKIAPLDSTNYQKYLPKKKKKK